MEIVTMALISALFAALVGRPERQVLVGLGCAAALSMMVAFLVHSHTGFQLGF
ncbi:hypothetical protein ACFP1Z_31325 [Streptomyces gamaensis]|uniref:NADH-quinone oxidoreductase subunit N n=1 Tax=Streptomyces gamaensis TaxID=1763542 RepID=A0ABW0ZCG2_9ACTN